MNRYGNELRKMCKALKGAEQEIEERTLRLQNGWHRCATQLQCLKQIHEVMDEDHISLYGRTLHMLVGKLEVATLILKGLVKVQKGSHGGEEDIILAPRPLKYAFKKESLDEAIDALETWQRLSDPSWFLILNMSSSRVDKMLANERLELATHIPSTTIIRNNLAENNLSTSVSSKLSLPSTDLANMEIMKIPFSNSNVGKIARSNTVSTYILDNLGFINPNDYSITKLNIRDLAKRLQHTEPQTFGLLSCKGFVEETPDLFGGNTESSFKMVFRTPLTASQPRSLRDLLVNMGTPSSLSQRFSIAQGLAKAVTYVHVFGFVHKNVRP